MVCATGSHSGLSPAGVLDGTAPAAEGGAPGRGAAGAFKVLVLLGLGVDVRIPPELDPRSGRVRTEWAVPQLDPDGDRALDLATGLRAARSGTSVTVLHLGPSESEPWLRSALARGCDRAVRVWDGELEGPLGLHAAAKAAVLAAAVETVGFDVVFAGAAGVVDAGGHLGALVAARLGVPCVTQALEFTMPEPGEAPTPASRALISRVLPQGFIERVEARLPVVVTVSSAPGGAVERARPALSAAALLAAEAASIDVWDLAALGVPFDAVRAAESALRCGRIRPPRPRLRPIAAPDPSLPAFERALALVRGASRRRQGRIAQAPVETMAEEVFLTLRDEGWLDHLRAGEAPDASGEL